MSYYRYLGLLRSGMRSIRTIDLNGNKIGRVVDGRQWCMESFVLATGLFVAEQDFGKTQPLTIIMPGISCMFRCRWLAEHRCFVLLLSISISHCKSSFETTISVLLLSSLFTDPLLYRQIL